MSTLLPPLLLFLDPHSEQPQSQSPERKWDLWVSSPRPFLRPQSLLSFLPAEDKILPYLPALMERMLSTLSQPGSPRTKELVVSAIGAIGKHPRLRHGSRTVASELWGGLCPVGGIPWSEGEGWPGTFGGPDFHARLLGLNSDMCLLQEASLAG